MKNNETEKEFLKKYDSSSYEKPSVTVDILLFTILNDFVNKRKGNIGSLNLLLIKRDVHPFKDCWALPGGFVRINESLEDAAYRELKEETNISENIYLEQLYTFGSVDRDPRMRVISSSYMALTNRNNLKEEALAGDDAKDAKWFEVKREKTTKGIYISLFNNEENIEISFNCSINDKKFVCEFLSDEKLAFDHSEILYTALNRLEGKVFYTDIAFNLLPNEFTLTELQNIYEIILGETLDKSNFRKKISNLVEKVNSSEDNVAHRPANLYKRSF